MAASLPARGHRAHRGDHGEDAGAAADTVGWSVIGSLLSRRVGGSLGRDGGQDVEACGAPGGQQSVDAHEMAVLAPEWREHRGSPVADVRQ
jgi:hypothetical protein